MGGAESQALLELDYDPAIDLQSICEHPTNDLLADLQARAASPAEIIDADLNRWADFASDRGLKYCHYGEAIWIPKAKVRIIRPWEGAPWSGSQLVKAYLDLQDFLPRRRERVEMPPPVRIFRGPVENDWAYVDLCHCYWQIGQRLSWWIGEPGSSYEHNGRWKRADELNTHRRLRLNLFGMLAYPGGGSTWFLPNGTVKETRCPPQKAGVANRPWARAVLTVVHAVALDVMQSFPDVPMWHTDGALIPADQADDLIAWISKRWRLEAKIKTGRGESGSGLVLAPGNYEWRASFRPLGISEPSSNAMAMDVSSIRRWWLRYAS